MALGYTLIYLAELHLPWEEDLSGTDMDGLLNIKRLSNAKDLCKDLPSVFYKFFRFVLKLKYSDAPQMAKYDTHSRAFQDFASKAMTIVATRIK